MNSIYLLYSMSIYIYIDSISLISTLLMKCIQWRLESAVDAPSPEDSLITVDVMCSATWKHGELQNLKMKMYEAPKLEHQI